MQSKITAHTLVRNEERYLWFAVASVVEYVDQVLLWDTGSTDNTVKIAEELRAQFGNKISFQETGMVDPNKFTNIRQKMLAATGSDWFIIVDGDEIWWDEDIKSLTQTIRQDAQGLETIVTRYYNVVGDIYHYQEESAGKYSIDGRVGHLTIRAMNAKIPGLHFGGPHGQQGVFDGKGALIQNRTRAKREFIDKRSFLHFTHMIRSSNQEENLKVMKRKLKIKYELGKPFPADFYYPEVFFRPQPEIVPSPWIARGRYYRVRAGVETPLRRLRRRLIPQPSGY